MNRIIQATGGFLAGLVAMTTLLSAAPMQAAPKVTATGGFNFCLDWATPGVALTGEFDGGAAVPLLGVVWVGATSQIPVSQFPAAAKALGPHTMTIREPSGVPVVLADGSSIVQVGGSFTQPYEIVSNSSRPAPTNPKWLKIAGTTR